MIELDTIYNEDCLTGMHRIPDGSVDCIICDLPYGTTQNKWDSVIPLDKLWEQYRRVIKRNGAIVLFSQQPFTSVLIASNLEMFRYEWIWEKANGTGFLNAKKMPMKAHENILVFYEKLPTYNPQMWSSCPSRSTIKSRALFNSSLSVIISQITLSLFTVKLKKTVSVLVRLDFAVSKIGFCWQLSPILLLSS